MSTQLLALTALTALTTESATLLASSYSVNGNEPASGAKLLASAPNTDATHLFDALQRTLECEDAHRHTGSAKYTTPAQEEVTVELVRYIGGEKLELVLALDLLETAHPSVYAANISKTPTSDRVWRQDSLLLECAFTMLVPELEGHSAPEGYTWAQARKHAEEARQQARAIIAAWVATETETETETETPSNEVLDSLFMVDHDSPRTGADILEDADSTLHALQVALNEGVCDEQNTALVTLVRGATVNEQADAVLARFAPVAQEPAPVEPATEEPVAQEPAPARPRPARHRNALAHLAGLNDVVRDFLVDTYATETEMRWHERDPHTWTEREARECLDTQHIEDLGYMPPRTCDTWEDVHELVREAYRLEALYAY